MKKILNFANDLEIIPEKNLKKDTVIKKKTPLSPGKWTSEPEYRKISCIRVSCGGGMGGAQWLEYVDRINNRWLSGNKFVTIKRIDGKEITINADNIVSVENFTLVTAKYFSSNPNYPANPYIASGLIEDWQTVELIDNQDLQDLFE